MSESSETEEDFIKYGTPFEPVEEDEVPKKKPCLVEDQVVRDKQGRRRFHGAFTGGFSAGFFNTVGSLEGWTPSSFKSSKSEKQKIVLQKPEDYMDEEDISEFGIAPVVLKTKLDYLSQKKESEYRRRRETNLGSFVFHNFLKPVRETVGMKLLSNMGWKPGQGIGPRTSKHERNNVKKKVYGCKPLDESAHEGEEEEESDSDSNLELNNITFAPSDYKSFLYTPKSNFFGIGYQGLLTAEEIGVTNRRGSEETIRFGDKNKRLSIRGQAFGVGAFEDEDEDIYMKDDMSQYDFSLESDKVIVKEELKSRAKTIEQRGQVLKGFVSQRAKSTLKFHPLPKLPKDFKCYHKCQSSISQNVFLKNSQADTDVEVKMTVKNEIIEKFGKEVIQTHPRQPESSYSKSGVTNFKPFYYDPGKQERFEKYMQLVEEGKEKGDLSLLQPLSMTNWDKERELIEFNQAAKVLKPIKVEIDKRFTPATTVATDDTCLPATTDALSSNEQQDCKKAANLKMFGSLTRKIDEWTPCQLLCKRFNIRELNRKHDRHSKKKEIKFSLEFTSSVETKESSAVEISNCRTSSAQPNEVHKKRDVLDDTTVLQQSDTRAVSIINNNNKIDLFKAIFLDDDDESDGHERREENPNVESADKNYEEEVINNKRSTSSPRGIFKNLELLSQPESNVVNVETNKADVDAARTSSEGVQHLEMGDEGDGDAPNTDLLYGPKIPDKVEANTSRFFVQGILDNRLWVEKRSSVKKNKKKDKKDKKSKKKNKSKEKHKKKKKK